MPRCKICGRKLTGAASITRQCGPICAGKQPTTVIPIELNFTPLLDPRLSLYERYKIASKLISKWD